MHRTLYTGRFVLTFPFRPVTGPARSAGISISPFVPEGELHESQSINKLRRIVLCLYAGFPFPTSASRFLHHHRHHRRSHPFSRLFICPARAQPPRRVSPIGIIRSGGASKRERKRNGGCAIAFRKAKLLNGSRRISQRAPRSTRIEDFASVARVMHSRRSVDHCPENFAIF